MYIYINMYVYVYTFQHDIICRIQDSQPLNAFEPMGCSRLRFRAWLRCTLKCRSAVHPPRTCLMVCVTGLLKQMHILHDVI